MWIPTTLPADLRDAGLTVAERSGWQTATNAGTFDPVAVLNHWDAIKGWPGYDVYVSKNRFGGILYHVVIEADGTVHFVAAGHVWNAGSGDPLVLTDILEGRVPRDPDDTAKELRVNGNKWFVGVCINYHPDDGPVPEAQYRSLVLTNAALCLAYGWNPQLRVLDHRHWTTRKPDISTIDLAKFRDDVEAAMLTEEETQFIRDLKASVESVNSNAGFAAPAIELVRRERTKPLHTHDGTDLGSLDARLDALEEIAQAISDELEEMRAKLREAGGG